MEIMYQIDSVEKLKAFPHDSHAVIRWINIPEDLWRIHRFYMDRDPKITFDLKSMEEKYKKWHENGCVYCALIMDDCIIAVAAVEKYSKEKWETADVRVLRAYRGKGYAKQIGYFVTRFILESGHVATCRTEEDNIPMQKVICALGFVACE